LPCAARRARVQHATLTMSSATLALVNGPWLTVLFILLGLVPGLALTRALRLPAAFCTPMVFATSSAVAYALFWLFFFWPTQAALISSIVLILSVAGVFGAALFTDLLRVLRDRDVWLPGALMFTLTCAYLAYLYWAGVPVDRRFTVPLLPEDNLFPLYLADRLFYRYAFDPAPQAPLTTFILPTKSSDRPPLQAAVVLAVRALSLIEPRGRIDKTTYQVLTTVCQMVWVPALYLLGRTIHLRRRQLTFVLAGAAFSGFFLLHSLYTWPKFFAAWLFLLALSLLVHAVGRAPSPPGPLSQGRGGGDVPAGSPGRSTVTPSGRELTDRTRTTLLWIVIGAVGALSLLTHGGPFFSALALPVLLLHRDVRRVLRQRRVAAGALAVLTGVLFLIPWMAYQKYYDPPGNMIPKFHLAGVMTVDDRSTLQAIKDAYGSVTAGEYFRGRWENLKEQGLVLGKFHAKGSVEWVQWQQYFHHLPALDFLVAGLIAFLASRRARARHAAAFDLTPLTWYTFVAILIWLWLLFLPNTAWVHHGSFATASLLFFCAAAWLGTLPLWAGSALMWLHTLVFVCFWMSKDTLPTGPAPVWSTPIAIIMTAAFVTFTLLLRAIPDAEATSEASA
jgi:hypothetical protein